MRNASTEEESLRDIARQNPLHHLSDMTDERRYHDDEVREIFEAATEEHRSDGGALSSEGGLTLPELQEIGEEVGLAPERIAEAASALDLRRATPPARTILGVPLSVGRTVDLPRAPTDREWEILVSELRDTFHARGKVESVGNLRQWTNGHLHVCVEPTDSGYRLRMGSFKENTMAMGIVGLFGLGMGVFVTLALLAKGRLADEFFIPIFMALLGAVPLTAAAVQLPRWVRERNEQMEYVGRRAQSLLEGDPED